MRNARCAGHCGVKYCRMQWLDHKVPPPLVAAAIALAMWPLSSLLPKVAASANTRLALTITVALIGIAFAIAGVVAFRRSRTTVNPLYPEQATALVTGGVYRLSRNPMYAGMLLCLLAWAIYLASPLALAGQWPSSCSSTAFRSNRKKKFLPGSSAHRLRRIAPRYGAGSDFRGFLQFFGVRCVFPHKISGKLPVNGAFERLFA